MDGNELLYADQKTVTSPSDTLFNFKHLVPNVKAWSAETPYLYTMLVSVTDKEGKMLETFRHRVSFRTIEMRNGQLLVTMFLFSLKG